MLIVQSLYDNPHQPRTGRQPVQPNTTPVRTGLFICIILTTLLCPPLHQAPINSSKGRRKGKKTLKKLLQQWQNKTKTKQLKLEGTKRLATRAFSRVMLFTRYHPNYIPLLKKKKKIFFSFGFYFILYNSYVENKNLFFSGGCLIKWLCCVQYILETSVYPREPESMKELRELTAKHPWYIYNYFIFQLTF